MSTTAPAAPTESHLTSDEVAALAHPKPSPKARIGSAMMSRTRQRGFRLAIGSWKIICSWRRMWRRSAASFACTVSSPSIRIVPAVGR